jgi:dinuclear metal center YbgI/SA1388 family protein
MEFNTLIRTLEKEFPLNSALDGDRTGLQIKGNFGDISTILCAYELSDEIVKEASENSAEMIILFHPLIYLPLTNINGNDRVTILVRELIKKDISLYIIHTNFDTHPKGTNTIIADKLNLQNRKYLKEINGYESTRGMGIIGSLINKLSTDELIKSLSNIFFSPIRYCKGRSNEINTCAIVGGSGYSFINDAIRMGADCFITADLSYHNFHQHKSNICLIEIGHYEMEQFNHLAMADCINEITKEFEIKIIKSKIVTNPVSYFPEMNYKENQKENILKNLNNGVN